MTNYEKLIREVSESFNSSEVEMKIVLTVRSEGEIFYRVSDFVFAGDGMTAAESVVSSARKLVSGGLDVDEE